MKRLALSLVARLPIRGLARFGTVLAPLAPAALFQGRAVRLDLAGAVGPRALHLAAAGSGSSDCSSCEGGVDIAKLYVHY